MNRQRSTFTLILINLFLFFPVNSYSLAKVVDKVAAKINGEIITLSEVKENYLQFKKLESGSGQEIKTERQFLDLMIEQKLKLQYARKKGIEPSAQDINSALDNFKKRNQLAEQTFLSLLAQENQTLEDYRKKIKEQITLSRIMNYEIESKIVVQSREVEKYYAEHQDKFRLPEEVKVGHIFFALEDNLPKEREKVRARAKKILKRIRAGEDFADLARKYSEGPARTRGGLLGYFKRGLLLPEFEKVVFKLREGEVSDLIETDKGIHILMVYETKKAGITPLGKVRKEIEKKIFAEKAAKKYQFWIKELFAESYVEILYAQVK